MQWEVVFDLRLINLKTKCYIFRHIIKGHAFNMVSSLVVPIQVEHLIQKMEAFGSEEFEVIHSFYLKLIVLKGEGRGR